MSELGAPPDDPWDWLHVSPDGSPTDGTAVAVVVIPHAADDSSDVVDLALAASSVRPVETIEAEGEQFAEAVADAVERLAPDVEWLWLLHDDAEPEPRALEALLAADADVVGSLLIRPQSRVSGTLVEEWVPTISHSGRLGHLAEPGEPYQGQFDASDVLGVSTIGMLIRRDVFTALGGFVPGTPQAQAGLEFGWRARLAGFS
ncbi:MAG: hypothetical protein WAS07_11035, partial [Micropruina sp.]